MEGVKHVVILLTVTLAGLTMAGPDQSVPRSQAQERGTSAGQPRTDAEAVNLGGQKSELTRRAQALELDLAGIEARCKALQEQIVALGDEAGKGSAGGGQLEAFTRELRRLAVDKAGKAAQQQVVRRQLEEVQKQLALVAPLAPHTDAEAVNLGGQKSELACRAQGIELDLAGIEARRQALQEQITALRGEAGKGAADGEQLDEFVQGLRGLAVDKAQREAQRQVVRRQLEDVQKQLAQVVPFAPRTDAEAVNLGGQKSELARRAQALELDLAGIEARRQALQEQIAVLRGEAGKGAAGGEQLEEFTRALRRLAIDRAGRAAQQQVVRRQLEEVQKQLVQALAPDR